MSSLTSNAHLSLHSFPTRRSSDLALFCHSEERASPRHSEERASPCHSEERASPCHSEERSDEESVALSKGPQIPRSRSEEHTSELQSQSNLVCRLLLEKKKKKKYH